MGLTTFVAGKQAVLDELVQTASAARASVDLDVFRVGDSFANDLTAAIPDGVRANVLVTNTPAARSEVGSLLDRVRGPGTLVPYGGVDAGHETFNHAKLVQVDGERLTASTAAMTMDDVERLDWGLTVSGPSAAAAERVSRALRAGDLDALRVAVDDAHAAGLHFNEPMIGSTHATAAWKQAIRDARSGTDLWIATKKFTSKDAARTLLAAADSGVGVHLVVARPSDAVRRLLLDHGIDVRVTPWPGPSLHGNLTVTDDRLLLGTMYYSKRAMGVSRRSSSRELLVGTTDPAAVAQARAAIRAIDARPA